MKSSVSPRVTVVGRLRTGPPGGPHWPWPSGAANAVGPGYLECAEAVGGGAGDERPGAASMVAATSGQAYSTAADRSAQGAPGNDLRSVRQSTIGVKTPCGSSHRSTVCP